MTKTITQNYDEVANTLIYIIREKNSEKREAKFFAGFIELVDESVDVNDANLIAKMYMDYLKNMRKGWESPAVVTVKLCST